MTFAERLTEVKQRIAAACEGAGRDPSEVTLVAVSKTMPPEACKEAVAAGQQILGENYAQELRDKARVVEGAHWHYIGPLQRNKIKYVVGVAELIHSVDRIEIVEEIAARATKSGMVQRCLIQVNVGEEAQKSGCSEKDLPSLMAAFGEGVRLEGLMCIPPADEDARPYFRRLRSLRGNLPHLSMGMSGDFEAAIEEGATLVRVGTALFGPRA
jgi:pyridoxal phosphate enzyme (YggS family)